MSKTVALEEATYMRLVAARANLTLAVQRSPHLFPRWLQQGLLSLDDMVSFMLDQKEKHGKRSREFRERKKVKRQKVKPPPTPSPGITERPETRPENLRRPVPPDLMPSEDDVTSAGSGKF